jgi:hypothetical protein
MRAVSALSIRVPAVFAGVSTYRYIRFKISPATRAAGTSDYGIGNVSRVFLQVVWDV